MNISIEYCMQWNYEPKALSLRESIQKQFGIKAELIKGIGGVFEIKLNDILLFSKKELHRFPEENEVESLISGIESVSW